MTEPKYNRPARSVRVVQCHDGIWRSADSAIARKESRQRDRQARTVARLNAADAKGMLNLNVYADTHAAFDAYSLAGESQDATVRRMFGLPSRSGQRCGVRAPCQSDRTTIAVKPDTHAAVARMAAYGESFEDLMRDQLGLPRNDSTAEVDARKIGSLLAGEPGYTVVAA
jgi:hypothetical protein